MHHELLECYALIEKLGRGVVYYGSARLKQDSLHWGRAVDLGQRVAELLGCTTWSGGGPGMMEAATAGIGGGGGRDTCLLSPVHVALCLILTPFAAASWSLPFPFCLFFLPFNVALSPLF